MMTAKMIETLKSAGIAKEWNKGNMHRLYIDIPKAADLYRDNSDELEHGNLAVNRYERNNGKLWIDLESGEICTKEIGSKSEVIAQIMELVSLLMPPEEENTDDSDKVPAEQEADKMQETEKKFREALWEEDKDLYLACSRPQYVDDFERIIASYAGKLEKGEPIDPAVFSLWKQSHPDAEEKLDDYVAAALERIWLRVSSAFIRNLTPEARSAVLEIYDNGGYVVFGGKKMDAGGFVGVPAARNVEDQNEQ